MCFHLLLLRGLSAFSCPAPRPAPGRSTAHTSRCPLARPLRLQVCTCPIRAPLDPAPPSPALAWAPWDLQTGRRDPDPAAVMWKRRGPHSARSKTLLTGQAWREFVPGALTGRQSFPFRPKLRPGHTAVSRGGQDSGPSASTQAHPPRSGRSLRAGRCVPSTPSANTRIKNRGVKGHSMGFENEGLIELSPFDLSH